MNENSILVIGVIATQLHLDVSAITPEKSLVADLGVDSLDEIDIVMCLEDTFDLEITDLDASLWVTVQDVITYIEMRLSV